MTTQTASKTERSKKGLQAARLIYPGSKAYKKEMDEAKKNKTNLIAWCGGGITSIELLYAFDILPRHIDNMAATFAAKQVSQAFIERAETEDFTHDMCSYYKTIYGYLQEGDQYLQISYNAWPVPDLLVGGNEVCITHARGIGMLQDYMKVPTFMFDTVTLPNRMDTHTSLQEMAYEHSVIGTDYKHEIERHYIDYLVEQNKNYISFLEGVTGKKLDQGKLREAMVLSRRLSELFLELQELRKAVPCPVGAADIMSLIGPTFIWAGSERGINIYEEAVKEAKEKIARKEGVVAEEKYRLFFESIPPWYNLGLFNYLQDGFGAVSVIEAYPLEFSYLVDPLNPLESLAHKQLRYIYNYSPRERADMYIRMNKEYQVDGLVFWNVICCKIMSLFTAYLKERVERENGIPVLILDADQADPRDYAEASVKSRLDAFIELMNSRKSFASK